MTLRVALLGFGTVGRAVAQRLAHEPAVRVVAAADRSGSVADARGLPLTELAARKTAKGSVGGDPRKDAAWVVEHGDADVVVDLLPTDLREAQPSLDLQLEALRRGQHVVSANKGPLALHGPRLRQAARAAGKELRGSATVCAGTPVLELLEEAFQGDALLGFDAVLNGSTNFVLSRIEQGAPWEQAIAEARRLGYLEADPSLDLQGLDAAAKAVILANAAWGAGLRLADARVRGILGVGEAEVREARAGGFAVRLVARASPADGVSVAPVTIPRDLPLVADGAENCVRLRFEHAGLITLRGPGAGGRETAAAVVADLLRLPRAAPRAAPAAPLLVPLAGEAA